MAAAVQFIKQHGLVITTLRGLGGWEVFEDYLRQVEFLSRGVAVIREFVDVSDFGNFPPQQPDELRAFIEATTSLINTHDSWTTAIFTSTPELCITPPYKDILPGMDSIEKLEIFTDRAAAWKFLGFDESPV